jgi:hypothetical protein
MHTQANKKNNRGSVVTKTTVKGKETNIDSLTAKQIEGKVSALEFNFKFDAAQAFLSRLHPKAGYYACEAAKEKVASMQKAVIGAPAVIKAAKLARKHKKKGKRMKPVASTVPETPSVELWLQDNNEKSKVSYPVDAVTADTSQELVEPTVAIQSMVWSQNTNRVDRRRESPRGKRVS